MIEALCGPKFSSSNVWLVLELPVVPLIVTGIGPRGSRATVDLEVAGIRIGEDAIARDVDEMGLGLEEAEADTAVVCGSLGVLLNGLNSQDGASFEAIEPRVALCSRERG